MYMDKIYNRYKIIISINDQLQNHIDNIFKFMAFAKPRLLNEKKPTSNFGWADKTHNRYSIPYNTTKNKITTPSYLEGKTKNFNRANHQPASWETLLKSSKTIYEKRLAIIINKAERKEQERSGRTLYPEVQESVSHTFFKTSHEKYLKNHNNVLSKLQKEGSNIYSITGCERRHKNHLHDTSFNIFGIKSCSLFNRNRSVNSQTVKHHIDLLNSSSCNNSFIIGRPDSTNIKDSAFNSRRSSSQTIRQMRDLRSAIHNLPGSLSSRTSNTDLHKIDLNKKHIRNTFTTYEEVQFGHGIEEKPRSAKLYCKAVEPQSISSEMPFTGRRLLFEETNYSSKVIDKSSNCKKIFQNDMQNTHFTLC